MENPTRPEPIIPIFMSSPSLTSVKTPRCFSLWCQKTTFVFHITRDNTLSSDAVSCHEYRSKENVAYRERKNKNYVNFFTQILFFFQNIKNSLLSLICNSKSFRIMILHGCTCELSPADSIIIYRNQMPSCIAFCHKSLSTQIVIYGILF